MLSKVSEALAAGIPVVRSEFVIAWVETGQQPTPAAYSPVPAVLRNQNVKKWVGTSLNTLPSMVKRRLLPFMNSFDQLQLRCASRPWMKFFAKDVNGITITQPLSRKRAARLKLLYSGVASVRCSLQPSCSL